LSFSVLAVFILIFGCDMFNSPLKGFIDEATRQPVGGPGDGPGDGYQYPPLTGTVTITGTPQEGQTLTADTSALDGTGDISFQWRRGDTNVGTNSITYIAQPVDIGHTITVTVTRTGNSGSVTSAPTSPITASPYPPLTGTVSISGTPQVGQTLTVDISALDGTGAISSFLWRRGNTDVGTNNTYTVQPSDIGYAITVTVMRTGNSGSVTSDPTSIVTAPTLTGTVSINYTSPIGRQTLTANTSLLDGTGDISFQWRRGSTDIGTNSADLVMQLADLGQPITVTVTRAGNSGSVTSEPLTVAPSTTNSITSFTITSPITVIGAIDPVTRYITIAVPPGTAINAMRVEIAHTGYSIVGLFNPIQVQPSPPGPPIAIFASVNFTLPGPIGFRVTPEYGDAEDYTVTVVDAPPYIDFGYFRFANGTIIYRPNHWLNTPYLSIPSSINGQPVTAIGDEAFYPGQVIYSVSIPGSVTSIGSAAFRASSLETVTLNEGLQTIGEEAFANNTNLNSITIPASVTTIGLNAFIGTALNQITIFSPIPNIESGGTTVVWDEFIAFYTDPLGNNRAPGTFFHNGFEWSTTP